MGRLIYGASIVQGLKNKLLLLDYFHTTSCSATVTPTLPPQDDDDLVHTPLPPTIWIVGLPRTGSTYFHSILALDTKHIHTYKQWELRNPVPSYATRHHAQEDQRQHKRLPAEMLGICGAACGGGSGAVAAAVGFDVLALKGEAVQRGNTFGRS